MASLHLCLFLLLSSVIFSCSCYKILAMAPMPMHSHYTLSSSLLKELAKKGHEVTVINPYPEKHSKTKNYRDISVEFLLAKVNERKKLLYDLESTSLRHLVQFFSETGYMITEEVLKCENVQNLIKSGEKFDLVIAPQFLNEGLLGLAHYFEAPVVLLATMPLFPWASFLLSAPASSAYSPNMFTGYTSHMHFWQRLKNTYYDVYSIIYHQYFVLPKHRSLVKKYLPGEPDLYSFLNNASLLLINSHVSTNDAVPQAPNVMEIGGFHIKEPQKLPQDLEKFLNESIHGVILFSMGSNLKSSEFPRYKKDAILTAFSKLKQNVLWKWESEEMPGKPKNVKLMKWLPQSDVLAHPNVKAFISHGGLLSTMESVYHGVPIVGIPIFADQKMNMATAVSQEYGVVVPFYDLTEERLTNALDQILNNDKYKKNAKQRSKIMQDRPSKPMDNAIFWIEYVVRHKGAPHLRYAGMDLYWYQRHLLDIFLILIFAVIVAFYAIRYSLWIIKRFFSKHSKDKDE